MAKEKERQGSWIGSCGFFFRSVLRFTRTSTTWQIPGGGLPFNLNRTGILVGKLELNPAVKQTD